MKKLIYILAGILIGPFVASVAYAAQPALTTFQGGTGTTSPSGLLYGDSTIRLKTVTIGSNLTFSGGTLSATGGGGSGVGTVATSSLESPGFLAYWNTTSGYPAKLDKVATTSLTASGVLSLSNPVSVIGASASAITVTGGTNGQFLGWNGGAPTWITISTSTAQVAYSTTTASVYIDSSRTDSYTADGSIFRPFTTIAAANTYVTASSYSAAVYYLAPGSSYTPQSFSFPNIPMTVYGNGASVIVLSGASLGAGTITVPSSMSWYDPVVFGKVVFSNTSVTTPHGLHNAFIDGSIYFGGLGTIDGTSVILDQNQAAFGFLSQTASSTIEVGPVALVAISTTNIQTVVNAYGVLNIDIANLQTATSSRYALMATSTGSAVRINGMSLQNEGTGGAINCANGASASSASGPNQISNIQITEGAGSTNGIDCGSATTFIGHYTIFTRAGARLSATGSDKQVPSMEGILIDTFIAIATSTSRFPFTVSSTTGPQIALTDGSSSSNIWTMRSINNSFFLATSSPTTYATSTTAAFSINSNGGVTIGALASCSGTNALTTNASGLISCGAITGSGGGGAFPFTPATNFGVNTSATTTPLWLQTPVTGSISLMASSTAWFDQINIGSTTVGGMATSTDFGNFIISGTASTTNLIISGLATGSTRLLDVTGGGVVASVALPVTTSNGGTGTTTYYNGGVVFASATPRLTQATNQSDFFYDSTNARLGLGTSTPQAPLNVSSAAGIQMLLSDGSSSATPWFMRSVNSNFYLGTTSPSTFATSTNAIFSILNGPANGNATTTFSLTDWVLKETSAVAFKIQDAFGTDAVRVNTASTTGSIFTVAATTTTNAQLDSNTAIKLFDVDQYGHITASSTPSTPTLTCTPTNNGTIGTNSNDVTGDITTGTLATSCTVTFGRPYSATPEILVTGSSATVNAGITARSTTAFTVTLGSAVTGDDLSYFVIIP